MNLHFSRASLLECRNSLFIYLLKNMIFRKDLESSLIFILFLRENKIRNKILSVTPYSEKTCLQKPNMDPGIRLSIGKIW